MRQIIKKIPLIRGIARYVWNEIENIRGSRRLKELDESSPLRIVIGASGVYEPGWTATNFQYLNLLNPNHWNNYFRSNSIDAILAEHVWEHLTIQEGELAAKHCFEYLKIGGYLRVAVPDGFHPDDEYLRQVRPGGTGAGANDHKILYDHTSLSHLFEKVGFQIRRLEFFDCDGEFHFIDWDPEDGKINRSIRYDVRNTDGSPNYTSIILDLYKSE